MVSNHEREEVCADVTNRHRPDGEAQVGAQLANAINLRSSQDQVLWTITGIFSAANAVLLVALFSNGGLPTEPIVGVILSLVGLLMSVIWFCIQGRAIRRIKYYERVIDKIERDLLGLSRELRTTPPPNGGVPARRLMRVLAGGWVAGWFIGFGYFVCCLLPPSACSVSRLPFP